MKAAKVDFVFNFCVAIIEVNVDKRSTEILSFLKSFGASCRLLFSSSHSESQPFNIIPYILYITGAKAIPLYCNGSLESENGDLRIGVMVLCY